MNGSIGRVIGVTLGVLLSGSAFGEPKTRPDPPPAAPAPFSAVAKEPGPSYRVIEGCVIWDYHCPPCPPRVQCSPCKPPHFAVRQLMPVPSADELVVIRKSHPGIDEVDGQLPGPAGRRLRLVVKTPASEVPGSPPYVEFVNGAALGDCPAPAQPALIGGAEISVRANMKSVRVPRAPERPTPGRYLLVGTRGVVAWLSFTLASDRSGACPYAAEFSVDGDLLQTAGEHEHLVVVGPVSRLLPKARLMRSGLAMAGSSSDSPEEPLGVPPPGGVAATYAVDLDGNGAADLATVARRKFGKLVEHLLDRSEAEERWERHQKTWSRPAQCQWHEKDVVGP